MMDIPYSYWPTAAYQTTQTTSQTARTKEEAREDFEQPDVYLIVPNAYCAKPVRYRTYQGSRIILIEAPADYVTGHADAQSAVYGEAAGTSQAVDVLENEDLLDWDFTLASPPPALSSGVVEVELEYAGWSTPIPVESPWTE